MVEKLALHGGKPAVEKPLPSWRNVGEEELKELKEVLESRYLFRWGGKKVAEFEKRFAEFYGVKHAVASTSGTAAIHIALGALGTGPGDEVITAPITDMGTIIPIIAQNAIPIFSDVNPSTLNIDPSCLKRVVSDKTKVIMVVHLFGMPCDMDPIIEMAESVGAYVVEDCCQAYLAEYKGRRVGTIGDIACFSLQQSKHMFTGDGGITVTNNDGLARRARLFMDKGWDRAAPSHARTYVMFGFNYRMTELQGAVALAQLKKLEWVVESRRRAARLLTREIEGLEGIYPPNPPKHVKHSFWHYPLLVDPDELGVSADEFAKAIRAEGVPAGAGYIGKPIYMATWLRKHRAYGDTECPWGCPLYGRDVKYHEGLCPNAEEALKRLIVITWNEHYSDEDVYGIAEAIRKVVTYIKTHGGL